MATWKYLKDADVGISKKEVESVLKALKESRRPLSTPEICKLTGYAPSGVRSLLYKLKRSGAVKLIALADRKTVDLKSLLAFKTVKRWSDNLKEGAGRKTALYVFARFMEYVKANEPSFKTPDHLIKDALDARMKDLIKHVDLTKGYIEQLEDVERRTQERQYHTIRGFYSHNYCPLPKSPLNHKNGETKLVRQAENSDQNYMTLGDVRKAIFNPKCSVLQKAVVLVVTQAGLDDSTFSEVFNYFAFPQIVKHFGTERWQDWDVQKCPVQIEIVRPKENIRYYTFIDKDAVTAIKDWLNVRYSLTGKKIKIDEGQRRHDTIPKSDPIFIVATGHPIRSYYVSTIFRKLGFAAGINIKSSEHLERYRGALNRYKFHSHEVRDIMKSLARPCGVDSAVVEFFLGHTRNFDKFGYDKSPWHSPDFYREQYSKLAHFLNVETNEPEKASLKDQLTKAEKAKEATELQLYVKNKILEEKIADTNATLKGVINFLTGLDEQGLIKPIPELVLDTKTSEQKESVKALLSKMAQNPKNQAKRIEIEAAIAAMNSL